MLLRIDFIVGRCKPHNIGCQRELMGDYPRSQKFSEGCVNKSDN